MQATVKEYECGIHNVTYKALRAGCPVCDAEREVASLRKALQDVHGQLSLLHEENRQLKIQTDIVAAIREASQVLDDEDLAFLKTVLYQWRDSKSVSLKTTHGPRRRKRQQPSANGFIAIPRRGDPYGHTCTSVGGMAIAEYFDEATNTVGSVMAMTLLVRGMAHHLPGATK